MQGTKASYRWVILAVLSLAIFSPNYLQYQLSPLGGRLMETLGITTAQFSAIFSAPMVPAIFLSLVSGILTDSFGPRRVIGVAMFVSALGACFDIFSMGFTGMYVCMLMIGFAAAFINANGVKVLSSWFPPEKIGMMLGVFLSCSTLAMALATGTTALFSTTRSALVVGAVVAIAAFAAWILFMRDKNGAGDTPARERANLKESLSAVLHSRAVWLSGSVLFCVMGCIMGFGTFLPTALASRGIDVVTAGTVTSVFMLGSLVGALLAPVLAARLQREKPLLLGLCALCGLGTAFAWRLPEGGLLICGLFLSGICTGGLMPLIMSVPVRQPEIGSRYAGTAGGVIATLQLLGAVIVPTYVAAPVAGTNYTLFYVITGAFMLIALAAVIMLPKEKKYTKEAQLYADAQC